MPARKWTDSLDPTSRPHLICPETRQPLRLADGALIARLNARIQRGELRNRGGGLVSEVLEAGIVRADGKVLYPVVGDLPVLLVEESIELGDTG
jgi:uncharacterized protein YbaR (Trm112 family)